MKLLPFTFLIAISTLLSGCFASLNMYSTVEIVPDHPETKVSVLDGNYFTEIDSANLGKVRLLNHQGVSLIKIEREGAMPMTIPFKPTEFNLFKGLDFGIFAGSVWYAAKTKSTGSYAPLLVIPAGLSSLGSPNYWVYQEKLELPKLHEYSTRSETGQMLALGSINIELAEGDLKTSYFNNWRKFLKDKPTVSRFSKDDISVEETLFSFDLKKRLAQTGYVDTTAKVFSNRYVESTLSAKLTSARTCIIGNVLQVTGNVEWTLTNELTGENVAKEEIFSESIFSVHQGNTDLVDDAVRESLADLFERTMVEFIKNPKVNEYINRTSTQYEDISAGWDTLIIAQNPDSTLSSVSGAMNSVVTVVDKNSHGSGVVIGSGGYIITNHHVIQDAFREKRNLQVQFSNGEKLSAEIIRFNPVYDLALIKIEADSLFTLIPLGEEQIKLGADVFAIGAPGSVDLGQTISKGIISGKRVDQERTTIQTDVPINGGNSGGALVYNNGGLIGIVNAKIVGFGVEGIGFAIPANYIETALKLKLTSEIRTSLSTLSK